MKILLSICMLLLSLQIKQYNYSSNTVEIYLSEKEGANWEFNNSVEQNDFFVFNSDYSKLDWKNPGGNLSFMLTQVKKDKTSTIWKAIDSKGLEHFVVLKESSKEIRIISDFPKGGKISMVFKYTRYWESEW